MKLGIRLFAAGIFALSAITSARAVEESVLNWSDNLPASIDPHAEYSTEGLLTALNVYDNLYRYQDNPPKLVPWLATDHTVSNDGLTWEFTLRDGVRFHDGSPMTADDVVYSFQRVLALNKGPAGAFRSVLRPENVTAVDQDTVRFVLDKPYAPFLSALPIISIVNAELIEEHEQNGDWGAAWLSRNEAGSGAFKLVPGSFQPNDALTMEWFPDHFMGWHDTPVTKVFVEAIKEPSTRVLALNKGTIQSTDTYLQPDQVEQIERGDVAHVSRDESMRIFLITMHTQRPPFDNLHVRRAMAYAFNYDGFINEIMRGVAERNPVPIPNNLWGYPKGVEGYDYDLEKAKAELERAKADGVDLSRELELWVDQRHESSVLAGQLFQSDLRRLGLNVRVVKSTFIQSATATNEKSTSPDMWTHWVSTYFVDPENWIGQMYDSQFHGSWKASSWYKNDEVDALLRKARAEVDRDIRAKLYEEAARKVLADSPGIFIYNTVTLRGLNNKVKGYRFCPVGNGVELRTISLQD